MDLIISPHPEQPIKSLEEQAIDREIAKENQIIEVPHFDFIFGDRRLIFEDCEQMVQIQHLKHQIV